jgi:hypothetical protein
MCGETRARTACVRFFFTRQKKNFTTFDSSPNLFFYQNTCVPTSLFLRHFSPTTSGRNLKISPPPIIICQPVIFRKQHSRKKRKKGKGKERKKIESLSSPQNRGKKSRKRDDGRPEHSQGKRDCSKHRFAGV